MNTSMTEQLKQLFKELTPPIFLRVIGPNALKGEHKKFSSYDDALKECTTDAYEEQELIEVILKKTKRFVSKLNEDIIPIWETSAYTLLSVINPILTNIESKTINVIDFGGACGAHYFHIRALIDKMIRLNWIVVETDTMVKFAKELETSELKFRNNISSAVKELGKIDLLHTSGTFQCVNDPEKYLKEVLSVDAQWLLFNRLGLNTLDKDVITIHRSKLSWNGIGDLPEGYKDRWIKYPFIFSSEKKFNDELKKNYDLVARFDDKSGSFDIKGEKIVGYGLLCKKK